MTCACQGSTVVGGVVWHARPVTCHGCGVQGRVTANVDDAAHLCPTCARGDAK